MHAGDPTRVVVVEDDVELRSHLRGALADHPALELVGEATDGPAGVDLCRTLRPEVVIVDLGLPDVAGHDLLTRLRDARPGIRVVMFTGTPETSEPDIPTSRSAGLVRAGRSVDQLLEAVEAVAHRPLTSVVELEEDPHSASEARSFVRTTLLGWGCDALIDDALVVVSELTTNAVIHGASRCWVSLSLTDSALRVEVSDLGAGSPEPQEAAVDRPSGRGLLLVSAMAEAWGVDPLAGGGKVIWAELVA